jgi:hypothetical protein
MMREHFKKISGHGTFPILIGAAAAAMGHSQMFVRSAAVVLCAVWFSIDVGIWIAEAKWPRQWKSMVFSAVSCGLCCLAMGIMYWFLMSTLEDQQNETYSRLSASMYLPPSGNIFSSLVSVVNGGQPTISRKLIACYILQLDALNDEGTDFHMKDFGEIARPDGTKSVIVPPVGRFDPHPFMDSVPISGGGEGQTDSCIPIIRPNGVHAECADVNVFFYYNLETQPEEDRLKMFRYVAKSDEGSLKWSQQPVDYKGSYCKTEK